MFPIFIFTGMGSEPQNAFLPPCGCFRRKQKQQMPCAAAALPVKKRIPENLQIFRNSNITTLIISKKPGNTGISRDIRTEFTTDLLLSD